MLYRPWLDAPLHVNAGWRAWRLQVMEPGAWMLHCHTLVSVIALSLDCTPNRCQAHMIMGMQSVWVFGDADDIRKVPKPMVEGYLHYGGGAYGNTMHDPCVVHYFDDN